MPPHRIEAFFKLVSFIITDQLRAIVQNSIDDFVSLFQENYEPPKTIENAKPITFSVKLQLDNTKLKFEPLMSDIQSVVDSLFDSLLIAADKIPRLETQLFLTGTGHTGGASGFKNTNSAIKPEQCFKIAFTETYPAFVNAARTKYRTNVTHILQAPHDYLTVFDKHKNLIVKSADNEITEFLNIENNPDKMADVTIS